MVDTELGEIAYMVIAELRDATNQVCGLATSRSCEVHDGFFSARFNADILYFIMLILLSDFVFELRVEK